MLVRTVQPEILDSLPAEDADAKRSRLDLRLINALMGNFRWIEKQLRAHSPQDQIVELGAGEGRLLNRLALGGYAATGIDLAPRPDDLNESANWNQGNLFEHDDFGDCTVVATLFLHHLKADELVLLGKRLMNARALIFSEPWRCRVSLLCGYAIYPFVNHVTRHDMMTSIRAGFSAGELPDALGLDDQWSVQEELSVFGAYRMVATKR